MNAALARYLAALYAVFRVQNECHLVHKVVTGLAHGGTGEKRGFPVQSKIETTLEATAF